MRWTKLFGQLDERELLAAAIIARRGRRICTQFAGRLSWPRGGLVLAAGVLIGQACAASVGDSRVPASPSPRTVLPALAGAALLCGCASTMAPSTFDGGEPRMRPEAFFDGETRSSGVLEVASGAPSRRFHVESHGRRLADGRFELVQKVAIEGQAPRSRTWVMTPQGAHDYTASLTDASGPVRAQAYGDLFHLTYALKGVPLGSMEQWLYLQPDGKTVVNEAVVRFAGVPVRRLSERISHTGV